MKNKYYTPTIEEFCVGFEYEEHFGETDVWEKQNIRSLYNGDTASLSEDLESGNIRVKHLDRKDIESLGFEYSEFYSRGFYSYANNKQSLMVAHQFIDNPKDVTKITILKNNLTCHLGGSLWEPIFVGTIKNKSELKKVLKMIGYE